MFPLTDSTLLKGISWQFLSSALTNLLRFLLVFVVLRCYTQEQFGLWGSITSIAAVVVTGDFGLTSVLRNIASMNISRGKEGDDETKRYFYSTLIFFSLLALILSAILLFFGQYIPFESLFKTQDQILRQQGHTICSIVLLLFFFTTPLSIGGALFFSYGENKYNAIIGFASGMLSFIIVSILALSKVSIVYTSISYFLCPLFINIVSTLFFIQQRGWWHIDNSLKQSYHDMIILLPIGLKYLLIGFTSSFLTNILTIYSGALLGLKDAAVVNVAQKIFNFFTSIYQSVFNPIWSRLSLLYFQKNLQKCSRLLHQSIVVTIVVAILVITITTLLSTVLVEFIAGVGFISSQELFCMVGICLFLKIIFDNISLLLVATNQVNLIVWGYSFFALISVFILPRVVRYWSFTIMIWCIFGMWLLLSVVVYTYTIHKMLHTNGK